MTFPLFSDLKRLFLTVALLSCFFVCSAQTEKKTLFFISNSHLDTQWNWDVNTTIREYIPRTMTENMARMEKYPLFRLNWEGARRYMWMKEYYPEDFARLKGFVENGQWHVSGMAIDATDVMTPSAESILHSMLYANRFYKEEFGVRGGYDIMLPDCFGFSYALPSLAKHAGMKGFHTAKLAWGSAVYDQLPPFGIWQGVDGAQIYAIYKPRPYDAHEDYNHDMTADASLLNEATQNLSRYGAPMAVRYVGPRGDRGGALQDNPSSSGENTPYWLNLSAGKKDGQMEVCLASPDEIFDYMEAHKNSRYHVHNDELPMRSHGVGAYTSRAELKLWNRKNELLADAAEKASAMNLWLGIGRYPQAELRDAWVRTLWQQHHDGITGTSIPKAYEYSDNEYFIANKQFASALQTAVGGAAQLLDTRVEGTPVVVYNPLSHQRTDIVEGEIAVGAEPQGLRVYDQNGEEVLSQILSCKNGALRFIFAATVPSLGYAVYDVRIGEPSQLTSALELNADNRQISNGDYSFRLSNNGDLYQLKDLQNSRSLMSASQLQMIYDHQDTWPAWEISYTDVCRQATPVRENVSISVAEDGPLRKAFRVEKSAEGSSFVQYFRMTALSDRIDVVNEVDWQSKERMLKVNFPFTYSNSKTVYDISLGTIERGIRNSDHYEMQGHQWADHSAADGQYGVSILNDSKYGWDKPTAQSLRLTLLHTPSCGSYNHHAEQDLGANRFTYSLFPHQGSWSELTQKEAAHLNQPLLAFVAQKHEGALGREVQFATLSSDAVSIKALKKAEDSDELIVRVYEWTGKDHEAVSISFPSEILSAREVNALEEELSAGSLTTDGRQLTFAIGHYQPKTFAVRLKAPEAVSPKEEINNTPLDLAYNLDLFSPNSDRGNATTAFIYAYPAEQIEDEMVSDGVSFKMGPREAGKSNVLRITTSQTLNFAPQAGQRKLYLLMASGETTGTTATITAGEQRTEVCVPYFSGYMGQIATSFNLGAEFRTDNIALTATHAHSVGTKSDDAYRFLYIYKYCVELPDGATSITIDTSNRKLLLFAATLSDNAADDITPIQPLTTTPGYAELGDLAACGHRLEPKTVRYSNQNGTNEGAAKANDQDPKTKWCVTDNSQPWLEYQFQDEVEICQWFVLNAGIESHNDITRSMKLQRYTDDGQWEDVDIVEDNTDNKVVRGTAPFRTTRVRLQILKAEQEGNTTRIYEFAVYGKTAEEVAIVSNPSADLQPEAVYTTDGIRLTHTRAGVNIIRYSDGTVRKQYIE